MRRWLSVRSAAAVCKPLHPKVQQKASAMASKLAQWGDSGSGSAEYQTALYVSQHYAQYKLKLEEVQALLDMMEQDAELAAEAEQELPQIVGAVEAAALLLQKKLVAPVQHGDRGALLELRPGVGGLEAALFAEDLVEMYTAYAAARRWRLEVVSRSRSSSGFLNEAILSIDAPGAYSVLRHESGIHRVQRIPATESKGRIHTSTAAVVVLPKMSDGTEQSLRDDERLFAPGEVRIDTMRSGGKGGQHVNTTDLAVRLVHIPTGIIVVQQDERLQPRNKAKAFSILRSRLAQLEREREIAHQKLIRADRVTTTDRSDKIRTYNFPQNRVTDHRLGVSLHNLSEFMAGNGLEPLLAKLEELDMEERLQQLIDAKD